MDALFSIFAIAALLYILGMAAIITFLIILFKLISKALSSSKENK